MNKVSRSLYVKAMINNSENNISLLLADFVRKNNYSRVSVSKEVWDGQFKHRHYYIRSFVDCQAFVSEKLKKVYVLGSPTSKLNFLDHGHSTRIGSINKLETFIQVGSIRKISGK